LFSKDAGIPPEIVKSQSVAAEFYPKEVESVGYLILLNPWSMKKSGNYITTINRECGIPDFWSIPPRATKNP
jgi:hypothetical protein